MYKIKCNQNYPTSWATMFCYQVLQNGKLLVTINSKRLLFEKPFLDYYAEACDIERDGLTLRYTQSSLVVEHTT